MDSPHYRNGLASMILKILTLGMLIFFGHAAYAISPHKLLFTAPASAPSTCSNSLVFSQACNSQYVAVGVGL